MKVYVAGPMRGYPEFNHPAFHDATARLRALGHEVHSPAEQDVQARGFNPAGMNGDEAELGPAGFSLPEALAAELSYICREAELVVVLPGWTASSGAQAEVATAKALGIPVRSLEELTRE